MNYFKIDNDYYLSPLKETDIHQLVKYLNDKEIFNNTLTVPFPYTKDDGKFFVRLCEQKKKKYGVNTNWAIRDKTKKLIGGCSFHRKYRRNSKKDEIGYWLARPYWNKGIMTEVVKKLCKIGFTKLGLKRIEAIVFSHNDASCRVLEKAGFEFGGLLLKSIRKNNKLIDGKLYFKEI
ncbi:MAG: GNAT family N-acetyltransferase [Ignavibacteriaceae bacterium]|nr:GNAT family N-acetyltransferase [Ignavibacteriaceae bacterium]